MMKLTQMIQSILPMGAVLLLSVSCGTAPPEIPYPEPSPLPVAKKSVPLKEDVYFAKLPDDMLRRGAQVPEMPMTPGVPRPPKLEEDQGPIRNTGVLTAERVPGRPGFVLNPFTQNMVDVSGIPSGTKVRDPNDENVAHVFKVP